MSDVHEEMQRRINNSSKCSNCYGPRAFGAPVVFCNKSYSFIYLFFSDFFCLRGQYFAKYAISSSLSQGSANSGSRSKFGSRDLPPWVE